jgi:hypothetical protein
VCACVASHGFQSDSYFADRAQHRKTTNQTLAKLNIHKFDQARMRALLERVEDHLHSDKHALLQRLTVGLSSIALIAQAQTAVQGLDGSTAQWV